MSFPGAETDRRVANLLMLGHIESVNAAAATARVALGGDLGTTDIPVGQIRAGALAMHWMPSVGEQVLIGCPSGDLAQAVILASVFAGNVPAGASDQPTIDLASGTMRIDGSLELTGDVIAGGISLRQHVHGGVVSGGALTGEPQ